MPTTQPTTVLSSSRSRPRRTHAPHQWLVPAGLIVLSLIPLLAGAFRLTELMGGAEITAKNARFFESPIPVVVHIVSVRPRRWAHSRSRRCARRALRPVDDSLLSPPSGRRRGPGCRAAHLRLGNAGEHRAGCLGDPTTGHSHPQRVDDARLRDRARRRNPGADSFTVDPPLRPDRRVVPHGAHDDGLGDQCRGGRIRHSPVYPPIRSHLCWFRSAGNGGCASRPYIKVRVTCRKVADRSCYCSSLACAV